MSKDELKIESAALEALAAKIGTERFAMWFTGDTLLTWTGDKLVVSTKQEFKEQRLRRNFGKLLREIMADIVGRPCEVEILLEVAPPATQTSATTRNVQPALFVDEAISLQATAEAASVSFDASSSEIAADNSGTSHELTKSIDQASTDLAKSTLARATQAKASKTSARATIEQILKTSRSPRTASDTSANRVEENSRSKPSVATEASANDETSCANTTTVKATEPAERPATEKLRWTRRPFARLETFVEGAGNQIALSAARSVLPRLGKITPLVFSGPPGCGKTHLLEGIWSHARHHSDLRRVVYLTAEQFTTHFVEALRGSGLPSFRRKYRDVELLLIDDIQFFAGKQSTLVEFLYTIDTLLREGRQLVLAADRPLSQLRMLGSDIVNRLGGGLVCSIDPADFATRRGILMTLAHDRNVKLSGEQFDWLAASLEGDARQLSGAMNRLAATAELNNFKPLTMQAAETALADLIGASRRSVRMNDIVGAVCNMFGLEPDSLQSESKSPAISHPRMLAMWLARKYTRAALSEIGRNFGRRSHTTVLSAQSKVTRWLSEGKRLPLSHGDCTVEDALRRLESQLRAG